MLASDSFDFSPLRSHFKHCYFALDDDHPSVKEHAANIILSMQSGKSGAEAVPVDKEWLSKQREFLDHILIQREIDY